MASFHASDESTELRRSIEHLQRAVHLLLESTSIDHRLVDTYLAAVTETVDRRLDGVDAADILRDALDLPDKAIDRLAGYTLREIADADPLQLRGLLRSGSYAANHVQNAVWQYRTTLRGSIRPRIDPDDRTRIQTELLRRTAPLVVVDDDTADHLRHVVGILAEAVNHPDPAAVLANQLNDADRHLLDIADEIVAEDPDGIWDLYEARPVDFQAALDYVADTATADTGPRPGDANTRSLRRNREDRDGDSTWDTGRTNVEARLGTVTPPDEVIGLMDRITLDTSHLRVRLRRYQEFAARYALTQKQVIVGDEMGLGKTIEALAVIGHRAAVAGDRWFLVVAPAAVAANWDHEIRRHSTLTSHLLHGPHRDKDLARWLADGGVAVTTYETLQRLSIPDAHPVNMVVIDEAHYIKNPDANRTQAVAALLDRATVSMQLTGTVLENTLEEFRWLLSLTGPTTPIPHPDTDPDEFRHRVAARYLRRRRADVAAELPDLVISEEWVDFTDDDIVEYDTAIVERRIDDARRVGFANPDSTKLARLGQLVAHAAAAGHKTLVFSFYLDTLAAVAKALGDRVAGVITGAVQVGERQRIIDDFTRITGPAVLLSQINAGGVGVNLQAASQVILTEPQWKPSTEHQAISRAYRIGQIRDVHVHRLVAASSIDEAILDLLETKQAIFDNYADPSAMATASVDAISSDTVVSQSAVVAHAIAQVEQRRRNATSPTGPVDALRGATASTDSR